MIDDKLKKRGITGKDKIILKYEVINKTWPYVHIQPTLRVLEQKGVLFI